MLCLHEFTVHQHIDIGKELVRHFAARAAGGEEIRFIGVPRVAPDVLFRVELLHPAAELHEFPLVLRFHRLAPKEGESVDVRGFQHFDDLILSFLSVDVTVLEVPRLRLEAPLAVVRAAADEKRHPDAKTVCDVAVFDIPVVHGVLMAQRCRTRSRISSVRPWFQNCVPM